MSRYVIKNNGLYLWYLTCGKRTWLKSSRKCTKWERPPEKVLIHFPGATIEELKDESNNSG